MFTPPTTRAAARIRIQVAQELLMDALNEPAAECRRTVMEALMEVDAAERLLSFGEAGTAAEAAGEEDEGEAGETAPLLRIVGRPD